MPWTRLDDGLHDHPKILELPLDAIGLWTVTLTWSSRQLTDGRLPRRAVDRLAAGNRRLPAIAAELVAVGLWDPDGDGWRIHDFNDYQPSASQVEEERKKARDRQAKHRTTKGQYGKSRRDKPVTNGEVTPDVTAGTGVSHVHPDPTRPETPPAPSTDLPVTVTHDGGGGPPPEGGGQHTANLVDTAMRAAAAHEIATSEVPITNPEGFTRSKLTAYRPRHTRALDYAAAGATQAQLADWFITGTPPPPDPDAWRNQIGERHELTDEDHAARDAAVTAARDVLAQRRADRAAAANGSPS